MFTTRPIFLLTALLSALCVGSASQAFAETPTGNLIDGWAVAGAIDGQDSVDSQLDIDNSIVLLVEKKSPYQADKFLQVFRHFSATTLRGKRIRMTHEIETTVSDEGVPMEGMPKEGVPKEGISRRVFITRVQCDWPGQTTRSIYAAFPLVKVGEEKKKGSAEFMIPSAARECTLGFATAFPLRAVIKNIKFEEIKALPPEKPEQFPLPVSSADLPALEISLPAADK